ncbi:hypothetical protein VTN00DRAFT_5182 [Thermoascus crustaceus]|uniref:uncharacterized protein n=1 Tax=Thermoascus crustaceus TaxID=5088 RepID=UPI00374234CB
MPFIIESQPRCTYQDELEAKEAEQVRQLLGNRSVDQFLQLPWDDRERIYNEALIAPHFLLMLWHEVQHGCLGAGVLLRQRHVTGSNQVAQEANQIYYSRNSFHVSAPFLCELLARQTDWEADPDGGFDPKEWVQRISVILYWDDITECGNPGENRRVVLEVLELLSQCPRLEDVTLEITGEDAADVREIENILLAKQQTIWNLDRQVARGVRIVREHS